MCDAGEKTLEGLIGCQIMLEGWGRCHAGLSGGLIVGLHVSARSLHCAQCCAGALVLEAGAGCARCQLRFVV